MGSNKPIESFRTHSNYLRAISYLVIGPNSYSTTILYECVARQIASSNLITENIQVNADTKQIRACLQSAWGTEGLLLMTGSVFREEEAIRLSNNWSAIQTYYVIYHCTQALHVAQGHPRPDTHPKTQKIFCNQWTGRPACLYPWTFGYGPEGTVNLPQGITIDLGLHPWSPCEGDKIWSLYSKALMTTRRDHLTERSRSERERKKQALRKTWGEEEATRIREGRKARRQPTFPLPQLSLDDKRRIDESTRVYTLIDYIYRLRIKTNYEDSNMFTDGPEDNIQSSHVRSAFYSIASGTLFLYENAIKAIIGNQLLMEWATSWAERNLPSGSNVGIAGRLGYH